MAPLLSFPLGFITKVPEKIKQRSHFIPATAQLTMSLTHTAQLLPLDPLPVLLSEVAPSFSLLVEASQSFCSVCFVTLVGFLNCV